MKKTLRSAVVVIALLGLPALAENAGEKQCLKDCKDFVVQCEKVCEQKADKKNPKVIPACKKACKDFEKNCPSECAK